MLFERSKGSDDIIEIQANQIVEQNEDDIQWTIFDPDHRWENLVNLSNTQPDAESVQEAGKTTHPDAEEIQASAQLDAVVQSRPDADVDQAGYQLAVACSKADDEVENKSAIGIKGGCSDQVKKVRNSPSNKRSKKQNRNAQDKHRYGKQKRFQWMRRKVKVYYEEQSLHRCHGRRVRFFVGDALLNRDGGSQRKESWKRRKIRSQRSSHVSHV